MKFSYALVIATDDGKIRTVHPGALKPKERCDLHLIAERAIGERIEVERRLSNPPVVETSVVTPAAVPTGQSVANFYRPPPKHEDIMTQGEVARTQGYTGDACNDCGQFKMRQAGHCLVCEGCGGTTGCS